MGLPRTFLERESTGTHIDDWVDFLDNLFHIYTMAQAILIIVRLPETCPKARRHDEDNGKRQTVWSRRQEEPNFGPQAI